MTQLIRNSNSIKDVSDGAPPNSRDNVTIPLGKLTQKSIDESAKPKAQTFICLACRILGGNQSNLNTGLQLKDAGVEFRTI